MAGAAPPSAQASGGVKRYLTAKHAWLRENTSWEHTIVVPGEVDHFERGEVSTLSGFPVPGTFNSRLPLNPRRFFAERPAQLADQ